MCALEKNMKIIALCGFKESGKTTTFKYVQKLAEEKGLTAREVSFANRLKEVCSQTFCVPRSHFDDQSIKEVPFNSPKILGKDEVVNILEAYNMDKRVEGHVLAKFIRDFKPVELKHPRAIAQFVGTELLRSLRDDIHCETLKDIMNEQSREVDVFVITDCRFLNELEYFKNEDTFSSFFIHRISAYESFINQFDAGESHPSEIETLKLIPKCKILDNNGNLDNYMDILSKKINL